MFTFIVRLFMLLAALSTIGLTGLDILKDHMGVDTDALLRTGGNVALAYVADLFEWWSGFIAGLSGNDGGAGAGYPEMSASARRAGEPADPRGNLPLQLAVVAAGIGVFWLALVIGRRKA